MNSEWQKPTIKLITKPMGIRMSPYSLMSKERNSRQSTVATHCNYIDDETVTIKFIHDPRQQTLYNRAPIMHHLVDKNHLV